MFRLACPKGVHDDRVISFLKNEKEMIETEHFKRESDDEGLVHYIFPGMEEDNFRYIVAQLQNNGVTMIGVDTQLTEKKIMKLADLIKEWEEVPSNGEERPQLFPPGENGFIDIVKALEKTLTAWNDKYKGGFYTDEKNRADEYYMDIQELYELYKEKVPRTQNGEMGDYDSKSSSHLNEQKVRKAIRKLIRQ
jgi:hypothetical protein